ncbi:MAG: dodecin family protein [Nitrososphaera sp.]
MSKQNANMERQMKKNGANNASDEGVARVAKIIELIGTSDKSWEDAAQVAIEEARKTIHGIHGIKIKEQTARVDPETGKIVQYRAAIYLSFGVSDEER